MMAALRVFAGVCLLTYAGAAVGATGADVFKPTHNASGKHAAAAYNFRLRREPDAGAECKTLSYADCDKNRYGAAFAANPSSQRVKCSFNLLLWACRYSLHVCCPKVCMAVRYKARRHSAPWSTPCVPCFRGTRARGGGVTLN